MPGADREEEEVVDTARDPLPVLAERGEVDVVLERDGEAEAVLEVAAERDALEPRDARRQRDPAPLGIDDAGDADDGAVHERAVEARRGHEARAQVGDLVEDARSVAAADLDVEPRPHVAAEVADRAAEEPAADVEPEHERRLGDGLEEDGAVPRPVRLARRLADEAGVEQRLERERHRRLRDAGAPRDLGAGDGRTRADRLEHRPLVQVLEERRQGGSRDAGSGAHRSRTES